MMNQNNGRKKKTIGVVAASALALTLSLGSLTAFAVESNAAAAGTTTTTTTEAAVGRRGVAQDGRLAAKGMGQDRMTMKQGGRMGGREEKGSKGMMDTAALVTEGLITQAQETSINELMATKEAERTAERATVSAMTQEERKAYFEAKQLETRTPLLEELVTTGVLTQDEVDLIQAFHNETRIATMTEKVTENLATFVTDGTLTTADVDAVIAYLAAQEPQEKGKPADGEIAAEKVNPFDEMVTAGILTQTQADAIKGSMGRGHGVSDKGDMMSGQ